MSPIARSSLPTVRPTGSTTASPSGTPSTPSKPARTPTLSRARPKELAHDYLERETTPDSALVANLVVAEWEKGRKTDYTPTAQPTAAPANDLESRQQAAAERWAARQQQPPAPGQGAQPSNTPDSTQTLERRIDKDLELRRDGPEDDLEL
jgi:hypothetical protein